MPEGLRSPVVRNARAAVERIGVLGKHLQIAVNGQDMSESGAVGRPSGQDVMSSGASDMVAAAIACPFTGVVNGPTMMPTIAKTGSRERSADQSLMRGTSHIGGSIHKCRAI